MSKGHEMRVYRSEVGRRLVGVSGRMGENWARAPGRMRVYHAAYGRGEPCKPGERSDVSGCIPSAKESGEGKGEGSAEAEAERIEGLAEKMDGAIEAMDRVEAAAADGGLSKEGRAEAEAALISAGMDRRQAQQWIDGVAGKPDALGIATRIGKNYAAGIRDGVRQRFGQFVEMQVKAGVPPKVARGIALASAVFAASPASITTAASAAGLIGAWGALPGLGLLEGLTFVGASSLGGLGVRGLKAVAKRALKGLARAAERSLEDVDPVAFGQVVARGADDAWDEARESAYLRAVVFLVTGGGATDYAEIARGARAMVEAATDEDLRAIVAG